MHGFVVDGENRKMSKSEGNVVHPAEITDGRGADSAKALGVDVLRLPRKKVYCLIFSK